MKKIKDLKDAIFYSDLGSLVVDKNLNVKLSKLPFGFLTMSQYILKKFISLNFLPRSIKVLGIRVIIKIFATACNFVSKRLNRPEYHSVLSPSFKRYFKELFRFCLTNIYTEAFLKIGDGTLKDIHNKGNKSDNLIRDGVVNFDMLQEEATVLDKLFRDDIEALIENRTRIKNRQFDRSLTLSRDDKRRSIITEVFRKHGVLEACFEYFNIEMQLGEVILHVSKFGDQHHFETGFGLEPISTQNFHFDPKLGRLKIILYLSAVGVDDGPFEYVPTTHRIDANSIDRLIWMKAISITNYLDTDIKRKVFNHLPQKYKRTAIFGSVLHDRVDLQKLVHEKSVVFTADNKGSIILFDPNGFHRGGLINSHDGSRINLQITLEPCDQALAKYFA